ncbi:MAG: hypothetical protein KME17_09325 [Cyanosarcina radialis HA8281-LM2]|jgi:hypothetical protein|nr:hypothetical protein [Cyanosarcina radialis HA8281-LM2]
MEYSLVLQQVVNNLERHEQTTRIRKMLICACKGVWENDPNKLNSFPVASLLKELKRKNPTPEELKISLYKILNRINKQGEYLVVAKTIFGGMKQLYDLDRELTQPKLLESEPSSSSSPNRLYPYPKPSLPVAPSHKKRIDRVYDPFGVRMEMMTYTNPLRAKIIIFSTIYRPFNFSNQDWLNLKLHELDDLTQALINNYESLSETEQKLKEAAQCIDDPEENTQTINAILQTIKPCYQHLDETIIAEPDLDQTIVMDED